MTSIFFVFYFLIIYNQPSMTHSLSVAIATYNEQKNIKAFLNHLKWVKEIIIVDGSSTDKTRQIARKYKNVKVIKTTNKPIFHINKQKAIDRCQGDWILQLDADERIPLKLKKEIQFILKRPIDKVPYDAFWIKRKNYFLGTFLTKGGQYPDPVIRLFKKGQAWLPCKSVHEQIEVKGAISSLKHNMLHYADTSFSRYLERNNRYTTLIAQQMLDDNIKLNFYLALKYLIFKPCHWFLLTSFRHKGLVDGFPGFVFSLFSTLRFPIAFIKFWELKKTNRSIDLKKDWN